MTQGIATPNALFALSELAFKHASERGGRPYYLAAAIYAFAYLFPEDESEAPSSFYPRHRWAVDLYNRALTRAFATESGTQVELRSGVYALPFGRLEVAFDPADLVWGDLELTEFAAAAEFRVRAAQIAIDARAWARRWRRSPRRCTQGRDSRSLRGSGCL